MKTKWFPATTPPTISGIYERALDKYGPFSYFDVETRQWYGWALDKVIAQHNWRKDYVSAIQNAQWRGLTQKQ